MFICKMLHIFQQFVIEQNYSYLKLEGTTSVSSRQPIINKFNKVSSFFIIFVFSNSILYIVFSSGSINIYYDFDYKGWWLRR